MTTPTATVEAIPPEDRVVMSDRRLAYWSGEVSQAWCQVADALEMLAEPEPDCAGARHLLETANQHLMQLFAHIINELP